MNIVHALILGILQGLTEFLPISSSGHLVLAQHFLGLESNLLEEAILFDLFLHLGTVVAVLYCYWGDIVRLLRSAFKTDDSNANGITLPRVLLVMFMISIIATAVVALPLQEYIVKAFTQARFSAFGLIITAIILLFSLWSKGEKTISDMKYLIALVIGIAQGIAVFPGISRSGITIVAGMYLGLSGKEAARYSFLLSVPTILLASIIQFIDVMKGESLNVPVANYIVGFVASAIFGVIAIKVLIKILTTSKLAWFAIYCFIAGLVAILVI